MSDSESETWHAILKPVEVKCYSGYTYAQQPRSFLWLGKEYEVSFIQKEWQEPSKRFFQIRTQDERLFELCYNENQDQWLVTELA